MVYFPETELFSYFRGRGLSVRGELILLGGGGKGDLVLFAP